MYRYLASGANDNVAAVWDGHSINTGENSRPLHVFREHQAAVKALAWCPWQHNILATGGLINFFVSIFNGFEWDLFSPLYSVCVYLIQIMGGKGF